MKTLKSIHRIAGLLIMAMVVFPVASPGEENALGGETGVQEESVTRTGEEGPVLESPRRITKKGVTVELDIQPVAAAVSQGEPLREGRQASISFSITDSSGTPIAGLYPAAWIDSRSRREAVQGKSPGISISCRDKINSFLQGGLAFRPEIDLNTYFLLTLDDKAGISVIDPHVDFSITKLVTVVLLDSPGEDWVLSEDQKHVFVTLPDVGHVAVVDTSTWKVKENVSVGKRPVRIAFQPDGRRLWVGNDGDSPDDKGSGVTVIDAETYRILAIIPTGAGHHEMAFSHDDRFVFVANEGEGTVSVIDGRTLAKVGDVSLGGRPSSLAYSTLSRRAYVADPVSGKIFVLGGADNPVAIGTRIDVRPGVRNIRFTPDGRWGFVTNPGADRVTVLDAATNTVVHEIDVPGGPDQIAFTPAFAYVRSRMSEEVSLFGLSELGAGKEVPRLAFPGGRTAPGESPHSSSASVIVPTPEENTVVVTNPADLALYYYMEGMVAPMGSFQSYGRVPRAVLVVDRSLQPVAPGKYSTTFTLPAAGVYDVAFLLDTPFMYHCFEMVSAQDPAIRARSGVPVRVEPVDGDDSLRVGSTRKFRFRVLDATNNEGRPGIEDVRVLSFLVPGIWQKRGWAVDIGNGVYEIEIDVPRAGVYFLFFEIPSLNVGFDDVRKVVLHAAEGTHGEEKMSGGKGVEP